MLRHMITKESIMAHLEPIEQLLTSSYGQGAGKRLVFAYDIEHKRETYTLITLTGRSAFTTLDEAIAAYNDV